MHTVDPTPESSVNVAKFSSLAKSSVSKRPIWLVEAACLSMALRPPTILRSLARRGLRGVTALQDHVPDGRRRSRLDSRQGVQRPTDGIAPQTRHAMPPVLAGPAVLETVAGNVSQAEDIVKLPVGKQPASEVILEP